MLTGDDIEDCAKVRYIETVILGLFYIVLTDLYCDQSSISKGLFYIVSTHCSVLDRQFLLRMLCLYCDGGSIW